MKRVRINNFYYESEQNLYYSNSRIDLSYAGIGFNNGDYREDVEEYINRHNANVASLLNAY